MTKSLATLRTSGSSLVVGGIPRVVGTLVTFPNDFALRGHHVPSDIVEVRLDEMPQQRDWLSRCQALESNGLPVILTTRLAVEGGKWSEADEQRSGIFEAALQSLSAVDVEFKSKIVESVSKFAKTLGKACIVSYHDFQQTPPLSNLKDVVSKAQEMASIVKISTMVKSDDDVEILRELLAGDWKVPVCVIGMGSLGTQTRITFATLGSCMTYGYLDKPCAPGQLSANQLVSQLRAVLPKYNEDFIIRKQVMEYV